MTTVSERVDAELSGLAVPLVGTTKEVSRKLESIRDSRVIAFVLRKGVSQQKAREYAAFVSHVGTVYASHMKEMKRNQLDQLIKILCPTPALSHNEIRLELMKKRAREAAREGSKWLTARQLSEIAGMSDTNPSAQPNKWKREGRIFAVNRGGTDYFPAYAIDRDTGRPLKTLRDVLVLFRGHKDPWGIAIWFSSVNGFLGGKRPCEMLLKAPESVIAAARNGIQTLEHG